MSNNNKLTNAIKWSFLTEIIVKFISPITSLILARLLTPSAFGIIASLTMITTFADMFTDAGFQKYIVQHQFDNQHEQDKYISVAFWSNLSISIIIYVFILFSADWIALKTGIEGYGKVIRIYSVIILLTSFSSIQYAVFRKTFQYKKLGIIRIIVKLIPLVVTIPLTLYMRSFWALVIGHITGETVTAFLLMAFSEQKIHVYYDYGIFKKMFSFCGGALLETLSSWLVSNVSIFIIGQYLGSYYLGLYKTSITTVNQIVSIITAATMNILFASLSEKQNDRGAFKNTFVRFQESIGIFTIPLGFGILVFRDFVTFILLGNQWREASIMVGLWGFVMCESVIFADMGGYAITAKGKPIYVFFSNIIQAILLGTALYLSRGTSFYVISIVSFAVRWQLICTHFGFALKLTGIRITDLSPSLAIYSIAGLVMAIVGVSLQYLLGTDTILCFVEIIICIVAYFGILCVNINTRKKIIAYLNIAKSKLYKKNITKG